MKDVKEKVLEMLQELSATDTLTEARAESLFSMHLFEKHIAHDLNLTPKQIADITFTLGRGCQLGVLFGILWHTNNVDDKVEIEGRKLYEEAIKKGNAYWRT